MADGIGIVVELVRCVEDCRVDERQQPWVRLPRPWRRAERPRCSARVLENDDTVERGFGSVIGVRELSKTMPGKR